MKPPPSKHRNKRTVLVVALLLGCAAQARADSETTPRRQGFAFGIGLGSGGTRSFGIAGVGGPGGALSIHMGTTAGERFLWNVQLDVAADPYTASQGGGDTTVINQHATLTLGGQYYLREVVWVKAGLGLSSLAVGRDPGSGAKRQLSGLGMMGAGGYDLLRSGIFALAVEVAVQTGFYGDGVIANLGARLSANWY